MASAAAVARSTPEAKHTVLVVEDDPAVRNLIELHLESIGYDVIVAPDALIARQLLGNARGIDLMIIDAHLPHLSGIDFVSSIMADKALPPIPVLLITGHEQFSRQAELLNVPCLVKPFSTDTLTTLVTLATAN